MPAYFKKSTPEILGQALRKVQNNTPISSVSPGSVARALTEAITTEIGDLYDIMDYNLNQNLLSTATGSALDMFGVLYNVTRKTISDLATVDKILGSFMFYVLAPAPFDINIPAGTNIYTDTTSFIGQRFSYSLDSAITIAVGQTRAYGSLRPNFTDTVFTAGPSTLIVHDFASPNGVPVFCTNPKSISQLVSFENDDAYRARIIKNLRVISAGTVEAVRYAALSVSGVRDVSIKQSPYGMGSFEAIIVPETTGNASNTYSNAVASMEAVRPVGVRMFTRRPENIALDLEINLIMPITTQGQLTDTAIKRASVGILRYINGLMPGSPVVYNRLISIIIDSSPTVKDVIVKSYSINGAQLLRRNYKPAYDEQIVAGDISIGIATA